jgi:hypothetical protein
MTCHIVFTSFCATAFLLFCAFLAAEVQGERGKGGRTRRKFFLAKKKEKMNKKQS